jgi:hypothetical protein
VGLRSARHVDRDLLADQSDDLNWPSESSPSKRNRALANEVVSVALKGLVLADADHEFQIAAYTAGITRVPARGVSEASPGINARRDADGHRFADFYPAGAAASRAGVSDNGASAIAPPASDPSGYAKARVRNLESLSAAAAALCRVSSGLGTGSAAFAAVLFGSDRKCFAHTRCRLEQFDVENRRDVLAPPRPALPASSTSPPAKETAEKIAEDIAQVGASVGIRSRSINPGMTVAVVPGSLVWVVQDRIRLIDFGVANLGLVVADIPVRVILFGEDAVSLGDFHIGGCPGDTENFVIVALFCHR